MVQSILFVTHRKQKRGEKWGLAQICCVGAKSRKPYSILLVLLCSLEEESLPVLPVLAPPPFLFLCVHTQVCQQSHMCPHPWPPPNIAFCKKWTESLIQENCYLHSQYTILTMNKWHVSIFASFHG